jgi:hypothetical protein
VIWQFTAMYCLTWEMQGGAYTLRGFDAVLEPPPVVWPKQATGSPRSKNNFSLRNLRHIMVAPPALLGQFQSFDLGKHPPRLGRKVDLDSPDET